MVVRRSDTCYFCKFWIGQGVRERGPKGSCRRYPPVVSSRYPEGSFPTTLSTDWCGEWQRDLGGFVEGASSGDRPDDTIG